MGLPIMFRIPYPIDTQQLHDDWLKLFDIEVANKQFTSLKAQVNLGKLQEYSFAQLLILSFEELCHIADNFKEIKSLVTDNQLTTLEQIFNYDQAEGKSYRAQIAKFYIAKSESIPLQSCYYCNLESITTFKKNCRLLNH